ncbi:protein NEDD1-like isoform X2 [Ostrea edulis]|uniref:protein NEDD1-like isoform X2 n=1 Tax=Ostrea edulis TaxID=37623 RepID=UPI0024AFF018|nr:protein NEDD1-like isoform X2 [Ostrea edulis]
MSVGQLVSAGDDIKLWNDVDFSFLKQYNPHDQNISDVCWSHDNTFLASVAVNSDKISIYSCKASGFPIATLECSPGRLCLDLTSTSRYLVIGGSDNIINAWDLKSRTVKKTYKDHKGPVSCVLFNANDSHIASGSESGEIIVYNVVTGQGCRPMTAPKVQAIRQLQFNSVKKSLLGSVSEDGAVNLWDINTRRLLHSYNTAHIASATGLQFSPLNDILLLSVGLDKRIICFDVQSKKQVKSISVDSPLTSVDVKSDGVTVLVGSTRGKVFLYDLRKADSPFHVFNAHRSSVQRLKFENKSTNDFQTLSKQESYAVKAKLAQSEADGLSPSRRQLPAAPSNQVKEHVLKDVESWPMSTFLEYLEFDSSGDETAQPTSSPTVTEKMNLYSYKNVNSPNQSDGVFSPMREHRESYGNSAVSPLEDTSRPSAESVRISNITPLRSDVSSIKSHNGTMGLSPVLGPFGGSPENLLMDQLSTSMSRPVDRHLLEPAESQASPTPYSELDMQRPSAFTRSSENQNLPNSFIQTVNDDSASPVFGRDFDSYSRARNGSNTLMKNSRYDESPSASSGGGDGVSPYRLTTSPEGAQSVPIADVAIPSKFPGSQTNQNFQTQVIRNLISEELEDFKDQIHKDILQLQVEMLRQFQIQMKEMTNVFKQHSLNQELLQEVERLREENKRLKRNF